IADAIVDARAAARALADLDGTLPDQPLAVTVRTRRGAAVLEPTDPWQVRFAIGGRVATARVSGGPDELASLARRLAGPFVDQRGPAAIAAVIGDHDPSIARHLHRRTWAQASGPWLGVGRAGGLAVASTCHLAVDGYGHALIASRVAARDQILRATLVRAA